jgi:hypothetical protein
MIKLEKLETPLRALTEVVPDKVPPEGLFKIAIETEAAEVVTTLPAESKMPT